MITVHRQFFGDRERDFRITPELIPELERTTAAGLGELSGRVFGHTFRHKDLTEIIRLGLIGGGERPEAADSLVRTYAVGRPLTEAHSLAVAILHALWFGRTAPPEREEAAGYSDTGETDSPAGERVSAPEEPSR
jgi:hypothetical protein